MKPQWVHYDGGAYVELARGLRIVCAYDHSISHYRVAFAGITTTVSFQTVRAAKVAGMKLANEVLAEMLLALIELQNGNGEDDDGDHGVRNKKD